MFTLAKLYINLNSAKKISKNKFTRFSQNMCKYLINTLVELISQQFCILF